MYIQIYFVNTNELLKLFIILIISNYSGKSQCLSFDGCPDSDLRPIVELYADSASSWITDFTPAFEKMAANVPDAVKLRKPIQY